MRLVVFAVVMFLYVGLHSQDKKRVISKPITIQWVDEVKGDFSFTKEWSYRSLGVEMKSDGRAGCADGGFCPERCYDMLDSNGIVLKDCVKIFYELLDTTHLFHTIACEAHTYEFAGTDDVVLWKAGGDTIRGHTMCGIATHSSLHLLISGGKCIASVGVNSITNTGYYEYACVSGYFKIDRKLWKEGILKADFSFVFRDDFIKHFKEGEMWWNGKIYAEIEDKK